MYKELVQTIGSETSIGSWVAGYGASSYWILNNHANELKLFVVCLEYHITEVSKLFDV